MPTFADRVETILEETIACQDPKTSQAKSRTSGHYRPFGPHIPAEAGSYPTTDAAMNAIAELADEFKSNNVDLCKAVGRDELRLIVSRVFGNILPELNNESDKSQLWPMVDTCLRETLKDLSEDIVHYVPVWIFLGQECGPFSIGPVKFIERKDWMNAIAARRGSESTWMPGVITLWSGGKLSGGSWWSGLKAGLCAVRRSPFSPSIWTRSFQDARRSSRPLEELNARRIARCVHPEQWVACAEIRGFAREESHRRGVLATRIALDTIRLVLPSAERRLLSTASDSVVPFSVDRLNQLKGKDLAHGARINRPGVSGAPGKAKAIVQDATPLLEAAGACLTASVTSANSVYGCPELAGRWCNAVHWFGRACISDED